MSTTKVHYVPWRVPLRRRLQTLAVMIWGLLIPIFLGSTLVMALAPSLRPWLLAYFIFILFDPTPQTGGRPLSWVKTSFFWRLMGEYFPMRIVKTAKLDPARNYIFGYHPHGIISVGAWVNLATDATGFSKLFPGIEMRVLTLNGNFWVPFVRELLLSLGICAVSRRSCDAILSKGPGFSCAIVVGGAAEALKAFPNTAELILKKRFGFIKVALRNGAWLVPVFSFGENDLWDQVSYPKGSFAYKIQILVKKYLQFSPPVFHGRGVFTYNSGIMPYRRPLHTVVGKPIEVPKIDNPTLEQVHHYHELYVNSLQTLFSEHKHKYSPNLKQDLVISD